MRTVVLLAFLVSSVAFSSEHEHSKLKNRCEKLFDSKKIVTCFEGKWSRGVSASPEDFYRKCFMLVSAYFQCKITSLQDRVEVLEKRHGDELERRIREAIEAIEKRPKFFKKKEIDRNKYPMWENLQP